MRTVIQRVSEAAVSIEGKLHATIGQGLMVLVGVEEKDGRADIEWMAGKIVRLRIFNDDAGVMNKSVQEAGGEILAISQFTLFASTKKGNRPSYVGAARPENAVPLYENLSLKSLPSLGVAWKPVCSVRT